MRLLDTDVCVEMLRGNRSVIRRLQDLDDEILTTWITAAELYFGAARSRSPGANAERVTELVSTMEVLDLDLGAALVFGEMKALLLRRGEKVPDADLLIGAIAASHGAVVVTGNRGHFERMPGVVQDLIRP